MSAEAVPGPACYGRGGTRPTTTDANLVLGRLGSETRLGGTLRLDAGAAREAIETHIAGPLGIDAVAAAVGHPSRCACQHRARHPRRLGRARP